MRGPTATLPFGVKNFSGRTRPERFVMRAIAVGVVACNVGCGSRTPSNSSLPSRDFVSRALGFGFNAPSGWMRITYPGAEAAYVDPVERCGIHANINVFAGPSEFSILSQFVDANLDEARRQFPDFQVLNRRGVILAGGVVAEMIEYEATAPTFAGVTHGRQLYILHDTNGVVVTCTATPDTISEVNAGCDDAFTSVVLF